MYGRRDGSELAKERIAHCAGCISGSNDMQQIVRVAHPPFVALVRVDEERNRRPQRGAPLRGWAARTLSGEVREKEVSLSSVSDGNPESPTPGRIGAGSKEQVHG
jgi:hypothetical protein